MGAVGRGVEAVMGVEGGGWKSRYGGGGIKRGGRSCYKGRGGMEREGRSCYGGGGGWKGGEELLRGGGWKGGEELLRGGGEAWRGRERAFTPGGGGEPLWEAGEGGRAVMGGGGGGL